MADCGESKRSTAAGLVQPTFRKSPGTTTGYLSACFIRNSVLSRAVTAATAKDCLKRIKDAVTPLLGEDERIRELAAHLFAALLQSSCCGHRIDQVHWELALCSIHIREIQRLDSSFLRNP